MTLAAAQHRFMAVITATDGDSADGEAHDALTPGMAIYRNGYRMRMVKALEETFPRTARWVGNDAFARAAAHHLIVRPPNSWTLDLAGQGFDATAADLFRDDPDVADLAALEWAMHIAFVAADSDVLTMADFVERTAIFGAQDWLDLKILPVPSLHPLTVQTDCASLWTALGSDASVDPSPPVRFAAPRRLMVWRDGLVPAFRLVEPLPALALDAMVAGESFGAMCARLGDALGDDGAAASMAGQCLADWIRSGLVAGLG